MIRKDVSREQQRVRAVVQVDFIHSLHARALPALLLARRMDWMGGSASHIDLAYQVIPIKIRGSERRLSGLSAC